MSCSDFGVLQRKLHRRLLFQCYMANDAKYELDVYLGGSVPQLLVRMT
jgi:hypothetical protein